MNGLLSFARKLRIVFRGEKFSDELAEEMSFHREQAEQELQAEGLCAQEAHHVAVRQFGNAARLKEESLDTVTIGFESALQDLRYAVRQLRKNPGFAVTTTLILAVGIGASTAIFSAVNPMLFAPLPYPQAGRVTSVWETRGDGSELAVAFGTFHGLSERTRSFDALAVMRPWQPTMTSATEPERFEGQRVSAAYFRVLGVAPALGRDFQESDDRFKGPTLVILSDKLWRRRFNSDASIVGRQVTLNDNLYTVIGVMPASFENVMAPSAELWSPLQYDTSLPANGKEWGHHLRMIGRLREGVTHEQARNELNVFLHTLGEMYAAGYDSSGGAPKGVLVNSLQGDLTRGVKPALLAVLGAVLLLLVIACVNVTSILLARGAHRRGEFAMRAALGAQRRRLVRQLVTESLLLASIGGVLGLLVAQLGIRVLVVLSPPELPRISAIRLDGVVFGFALAITTLVGLVLGILPALHASRTGPQIGLQQISRATAGGHQWMRHALVVAEFALALVLLVSAGLLFRSLQRVFAVAPGFDTSHLLTMQVQESGHRFDSDAARDRFFTQALESARQVPGVTAAAFTSQLPLSGDYDTYGVEFEAFPNDKSEPAFRYGVSGGYFETMRIPLRRGRFLGEEDRVGAPLAVVINESFANRKFPGKDPIGQRVKVGPNAGQADKPWATIVGVVGDVKQLSLGIDQNDAVYTTTTQWSWVDPVQSLVVRTPGDAAELAPAIRKAIWSVDKDQPIVRVATMGNLLAASEAQRHFALILFEAFALVAMFLAATGMYGVMAGSVIERMREIGVRLAVGASRANILALIVRQAMTLAGLGVVVGLSGAAIASRALIALLFGISPLDPATYVGVVALLVAVSGIACWVPAWRAARVDPAITLRAE